MGTRPTYHPIGSTTDPTDRTALVEVCVVCPHRPTEPPIIYVTKYHGREVGERSIGLHPDIADNIAAMLRAAVAVCGCPNRPEGIGKSGRKSPAIAKEPK